MKHVTIDELTKNFNFFVELAKKEEIEVSQNGKVLFSFVPIRHKANIN